MSFLKKLFYACFLLTVVFGGGMLIFGKLLPPDWFVSRDIVINATPAQVYPLVADFKQWPKWSPWRRDDPAMAVTLSSATTGVGATQSWRSPTEGSGSLRVVEAAPPRMVHFAVQATQGGSVMAYDESFRLDQRQDGKTDLEWVARGNEERILPKLRAQLLFDHTMGGRFEQGLSAIKSLAEQPAGTPAP